MVIHVRRMNSTVAVSAIRSSPKRESHKEILLQQSKYRNILKQMEYLVTKSMIQGMIFVISSPAAFNSNQN